MIFCVTLSIILILTGIVIQNNRILAAIQSIWIWLVVGFTNGEMDFAENNLIYKNTAYAKISSPSTWLSNLIGNYTNSMGMEYWEYNAVVSAVLILILYWIILKNTKKISLFYSLFLIYPLVDSVIQKRFFIAFVFCVISLIAMKNNNIKMSIIAIICALGFHFSAIILVPYLFMDIILKKHIKVIWMILALEVYIIFFQRNLVAIILGDNSAKVTTYMNNNISLKAGLLFVCVQVILVLLTLYIENPNLFLRNLSINSRENYIMRINIFSLLFIPLLFMDSTFFRFYRIIMVVTYTDIGKAFRGKLLKNSYRYYMGMAYIILIITFQVMTVNLGEFGWNEVLDTLFKYNQVLGGIACY